MADAGESTAPHPNMTQNQQASSNQAGEPSQTTHHQPPLRNHRVHPGRAGRRANKAMRGQFAEDWKPENLDYALLQGGSHGQDKLTEIQKQVTSVNELGFGPVAPGGNQNGVKRPPGEQSMATSQGLEGVGTWGACTARPGEPDEGMDTLDI